MHEQRYEANSNTFFDLLEMDSQGYCAFGSFTDRSQV